MLLVAFVALMTGIGHGLRLQMAHELLREKPQEEVLNSHGARIRNPLTALALLLLPYRSPAGWHSPARCQALLPGVSRARAISAMSVVTESKADTVLQRPRKIARIEQTFRLPVWPAWNGVFFILLDFLGLKELAAQAEDAFGGRVCPMILDTAEADPFILAVHHRHSWLRFDPLRGLFRSIIAEGFPAHPHRGFETLTYVLPGKRGLVHRDSMGLKMEYGDGECQWMTAGSGILHEEMWSNDLTDSAAEGLTFDSELYQIWLNLPSSHKMTEPRIQLLRPAKQKSAPSAPPKEVPVLELPTVSPSEGVMVRVLAGKVGDVASKVDTFSDVSVMHTIIAPGSTWDLPLPPDYTAMIYVRRGNSLQGSSSGEPLPLHHLVNFERAESTLGAGLSDGIRLKNPADASEVADVLLLAGRPLREPVAEAGNFVMNTDAELRQAQYDFSVGPLSRPWDHKLSDEAWKSYVSEAYGSAEPSDSSSS